MSYIDCREDEDESLDSMGDYRYDGSDDEYAAMDLVQCQGCGRYAGMHMLGRPHACHIAADGTREEGGTYQ